MPAPVILLNGDQIGQHGAGILDLSHRQQSKSGFNTVARPDKMIAAGTVGCIPPRDTETRDDRTGVGAVLVHFENHGRKISFSPGLGWSVRNREAFLPVLPSFDEFAAYR